VRKRTYDLIGPKKFDISDPNAIKRRVEKLDAYLSSDLPIDDRMVVLSERAGLVRILAEVQRQYLLEDAEHTLNELVELDPEDIQSLLSMGSHHLYSSRRLDKALDWTQRVAKIALKQRMFVRQALGQLIRVALERKDYALVSRCLVRLTMYDPAPENVDIRLELDFVPRIPKGRVAPRIVRAYKVKATRARSVRGRAPA
jgi:hypothetical protein